MPAEKKVEHTPLPWHTEERTLSICRLIISGEDVDAYQILSESGQSVGYLHRGDAECEANARHIVLSANYHERLVDALNKALAYLANPQAFDAEELGRDWFALKAELAELEKE